MEQQSQIETKDKDQQTTPTHASSPDGEHHEGEDEPLQHVASSPRLTTINPNLLAAIDNASKHMPPMPDGSVIWSTGTLIDHGPKDKEKNQHQQQQRSSTLALARVPSLDREHVETKGESSQSVQGQKENKDDEDTPGTMPPQSSPSSTRHPANTRLLNEREAEKDDTTIIIKDDENSCLYSSSSSSSSSNEDDYQEESDAHTHVKFIDNDMKVERHNKEDEKSKKPDKGEKKDKIKEFETIDIQAIENENDHDNNSGEGDKTPEPTKKPFLGIGALKTLGYWAATVGFYVLKFFLRKGNKKRLQSGLYHISHRYAEMGVDFRNVVFEYDENGVLDILTAMPHEGGEWKGRLVADAMVRKPKPVYIDDKIQNLNAEKNVYDSWVITLYVDQGLCTIYNKKDAGYLNLCAHNTLTLEKRSDKNWLVQEITVQH